MKRRGWRGNVGSRGLIMRHLAPPHPGCGVSTIFHDAFNLVLQLIENTHQLPLSDFIYCIREPALTGSPGRKSPRRLTDEN